MAENQVEQYYTPDPQDIRIGYQCEILPKLYMSAQTWKSKVCKNPEDIEQVLTMLKERRVRSCYLSIGDLVHEGWELIKNKDDDFFTFINGNTQLDFRKSSRKILLGSGLYTGECKDINNFRTITKWLNLN